MNALDELLRAYRTDPNLLNRLYLAHRIATSAVVDVIRLLHHGNPADPKFNWYRFAGFGDEEKGRETLAAYSPQEVAAFVSGAQTYAQIVDNVMLAAAAADDTNIWELLGEAARIETRLVGQLPPQVEPPGS